MNPRLTVAAIALFATILYALAPIIRGGVQIPTAQHHLLHAAMLAGAAFSGILFAGWEHRERRGAGGWLVAAVIAPVLAMLLMWPSEYSYFELHPYGHVAEHLGLIGLGFLTGYSGQQYANGIGWASGISICAMAVLAAWGYGVGPPLRAELQPASAATVSSASTANPARGASVFAKNCAVCHGVAGAGGEGPSLKNERARKSPLQAEAWIKNPAPPMPKLYPGTLSAQDVADVAAYVETLR
jgi:mono/diheme cytochrome c family protein